mmetsp:Transcript_55955/g.166446  ORF Transcript_55955/g.166446 Transcript_55955/m.166446 type:complete len:217 (-) Transcript_55955:301-951(-)
MSLLDCRAYGLVLHDIVDGSQDEHGLQPVLPDAVRIDAHGHRCRLEEPRRREQLVALDPRKHVVEVDLLFCGGHVDKPLSLHLVERRRVQHGLYVPLVVVAKAEALLAVEVQPHQPVDGVESAKGPGELLEARPAGAQHLLRAFLARLLHGGREGVERKLWEGMHHVVVELLERVGGVTDPRDGPVHRPPIRGDALRKRPGEVRVRQVLGLAHHLP